MVAAGERNTHEWTPAKREMMEAFDRAGIPAAFMAAGEGGFIVGPKNLALSLAAFELAWVDGGAATAAWRVFWRWHRSTNAERRSRCVITSVWRRRRRRAKDRRTWRGAFALTEPIPYVGVDTGVLSGKVRSRVERRRGSPGLQVDKRGRFITNIAFADFVTAAVNSGDPRIKGSCVVILEQGDEGIFDRGTPTRKLVHQLSLHLRPGLQPEGPGQPNHWRIHRARRSDRSELQPRRVIEAVFRRTRVTVGLMTAAKLLSAVEPIIRYQRGASAGWARSPVRRATSRAFR